MPCGKQVVTNQLSQQYLPSLSPVTFGDDTYILEKKLHERGLHPVAGVDEAGRGPLAGPVVAASVVLSPECDPTLFKDSKKLSAGKRATLFDLLYASGSLIGVGHCTPQEIDSINILQASLLAMKRSVEALVNNTGRETRANVNFLLVDGKFTIPMDIAQLALVKGESKSASIAAASIIAKVTRDKLMVKLHDEFPQYNFKQHKGYPTRAHKQAIIDHGPSPVHRKTFKGVKEFFRQ